MTKPIEYTPEMELNSKGNRRGKQEKKGGRFSAHVDATWAPLNVRKAQALAMLEGGSSYKEVQLATGLGTTTIAKVKRGDYDLPLGVVKALRDCEEAKYTWMHHKLLDSIDDEVINRANLVQRVTAAGILFDKRELKAGRATQRIEVGRSDEDLAEEIERLRAAVIDVTPEKT